MDCWVAPGANLLAVGPGCRCAGQEVDHLSLASTFAGLALAAISAVLAGGPQSDGLRALDSAHDVRLPGEIPAELCTYVELTHASPSIDREQRLLTWGLLGDRAVEIGSRLRGVVRLYVSNDLAFNAVAYSDLGKQCSNTIP